MAKPSKKQRGKLKATSVKPADAKKKHIKFNSEGDVAVSKAVLKKKRARTNESAQKEGKGKSDRSPENIQQAKYYLEKWKTRNEPIAEGELPWKFKKIRQAWILNWMYESDTVPKSMFTVVLEYIAGIEGAARARVLESAHEIIDQGEPEKVDEDAEGEIATKLKLARRKYKRALQVAKVLA